MIHMPREGKQKAGDKAEQGNHNQHHVGRSHQLRRQSELVKRLGLLSGPKRTCND
jgi:hypothetical protein